MEFFDLSLYVYCLGLVISSLERGEYFESTKTRRVPYIATTMSFLTPAHMDEKSEGEKATRKWLQCTDFLAW